MKDIFEKLIEEYDQPQKHTNTILDLIAQMKVLVLVIALTEERTDSFEIEPDFFDKIEKCSQEVLIDLAYFLIKEKLEDFESISYEIKGGRLFITAVARAVGEVTLANVISKSSSGIQTFAKYIKDNCLISKNFDLETKEYNCDISLELLKAINVSEEEASLFYNILNMAGSFKRTLNYRGTKYIISEESKNLLWA